MARRGIRIAVGVMFALLAERSATAQIELGVPTAYEPLLNNTFCWIPRVCIPGHKWSDIGRLQRRIRLYGRSLRVPLDFN